jgi:hypothetical protein
MGHPPSSDKKENAEHEETEFVNHLKKEGTNNEKIELTQNLREHCDIARSVCGYLCPGKMET